MNLRHKIKIFSYTLLAIILIAYSVYSARSLLRGPSLTVYEPEDYITVATSTVLIRGLALNAKILTLNDQPILIDEQGNFVEIRLLEHGLNVYKLFIKDKFNRENQKILRVFRQDTF